MQISKCKCKSVFQYQAFLFKTATNIRVFALNQKNSEFEVFINIDRGDSKDFLHREFELSDNIENFKA
jgi:hypothetical protein